METFGSANATTTLENGIRSYAWTINAVSASTNDFALSVIYFYIDGNDLQIPITLTAYRTVNGSTAEEILTHDTPSLSGVYSYLWTYQTDLSHSYEGCTGDMELKLSISFDTSGQQNFDDNYLNELMLPNSVMKILYFRPA